jgi:uncharacterized protein YbbC (DUF1343 family)
MILEGGIVGKVRILSPLSVEAMTRPRFYGDSDVRGLGWDIDSRFSSNRGELLPAGSFGHTGFTGTSLWLDPSTGAYVIFLSNRVHPDGKGDVTPLRARVATLAAAALIVPEPAPGPGRGPRDVGFARGDFGAASRTTPPRTEDAVLAGLDVLRQEGFSRLRGRKVGLLTTPQMSARDGVPSVKLLREAPGIDLVAAGPALDGIDTLVVDLPAGGSRLDDSLALLVRMLADAARRRIAVIVLDRPNPIGGFQIEGPAGAGALPIRHGLTIGELARAINAEKAIGADLAVVAMKNWRRELWFDETGLPWTDPSADVRTLAAAALHPGLAGLEAANVSVGRGTDRPYEQVGAPWIDGVRLAAVLNARGLPGARVLPVRFTPAAAPHSGLSCGGVALSITDRAALRPVRVGLEIASALVRLFPGQFQPAKAEALAGTKEALARLEAGEDPAVIAAGWAGEEAAWRLRRAAYLLYP